MACVNGEGMTIIEAELASGPAWLPNFSYGAAMRADYPYRGVLSLAKFRLPAVAA